MQGIENLPFCRAQGHSSLGGGVSSCSTSEALLGLGSGDDEFEDRSFFTPSLSILLLLDRFLRFFNWLWFLHLDSLRMLLLCLFLIKEGLSRGKSKYFFSSSKVELGLSRSHIYARVCSIKERTAKD